MAEENATAVVAAPPPILIQLAREMVEAEKKVEEGEESLKKLKVQAEIAEKKLVDQMLTEQLKNFKAVGLGGFRIHAELYANVKDKEALVGFIKKRMKKLGFLFSAPSVNNSKLRSWVKELTEQGKDLPPGVDTYTPLVIRRFDKEK